MESNKQTIGDTDFLESLKPDVIDILEELGNKVNALLNKRKEIAFMEEKLEEANKKEKELSEDEIPMLLLSRGLSSIKLKTGEKVEIIEKLAAGIPKKDKLKRAAIFKWLIENKGAYLVKKELIVDEPEDSIINFLREKGIPFSNELNVNTNSFKAFLSDKLGMKKGSLQTLELSEIPKEANPYIYKKTDIK